MEVVSRGKGRPRPNKAASKKQSLEESATHVVETSTRRTRKQIDKYSPDSSKSRRKQPSPVKAKNVTDHEHSGYSSCSSEGLDRTPRKRSSRNTRSPAATAKQPKKNQSGKPKTIVDEHILGLTSGSGTEEDEEEGGVRPLVNNVQKRQQAKEAKKKKTQKSKKAQEDEDEMDDTEETEEHESVAGSSKDPPAAGSSNHKRKKGSREVSREESHSPVKSPAKRPGKGSDKSPDKSSPDKKALGRRRRQEAVTYPLDTMNELVSYIEDYPILWDNSDDKIDVEAVDECWKGTLQLPTLVDKPNETGE